MWKRDFGGAIKQLGMGFAARGGKLISILEYPLYRVTKSIACGICAENVILMLLPFQMLQVIDEEKCSGCAGCIAICPKGAIRNVWGGSNFRENWQSMLMALPEVKILYILLLFIYY